ncbi:MAG: hypothetical protein ACLF0P_01820 [Thermoanaerobaculia bacterium]
MPKGKRPSAQRKPDKGRLYREVTYLHADELDGLVEAAERLRCSKAEVMRRALREFFGIED